MTVDPQKDLEDASWTWSPSWTWGRVVVVDPLRFCGSGSWSWSRVLVLEPLHGRGDKLWSWSHVVVAEPSRGLMASLWYSICFVDVELSYTKRLPIILNYTSPNVSCLSSIKSRRGWVSKRGSGKGRVLLHFSNAHLLLRGGWVSVLKGTHKFSSCFEIQRQCTRFNCTFTCPLKPWHDYGALMFWKSEESA